MRFNEGARPGRGGTLDLGECISRKASRHFKYLRDANQVTLTASDGSFVALPPTERQHVLPPKQGSDMEASAYLQEKAARCRRLAACIPTANDPTAASLRALATEFEAGFLRADRTVTGVFCDNGPDAQGAYATRAEVIGSAPAKSW